MNSRCHVMLLTLIFVARHSWAQSSATRPSEDAGLVKKVDWAMKMVDDLQNKLVQQQRVVDWILDNHGQPTAASQGLYKDRVLIIWWPLRPEDHGSEWADFTYAIYRKVQLGEPDNGTELAQVNGTVAKYEDRTAEPGKRYYYRIYRYRQDPVKQKEVNAATDSVWLFAGRSLGPKFAEPGAHRDDSGVWVKGWAGQPAP